MTYVVYVLYTNDETAHLECQTLEEAKMVRQSFINYGKDILDVSISALDDKK